MNRAFLMQLTDFIFVCDKPQPSDIIFIPGNRHPQMAERAAFLVHDRFAPLVMPSGFHSITVQDREYQIRDATGRYPGAYASEAAFLTEVLIRNGVDPSRILREERATFTCENAKFSRTLADRLRLHIKKAVICCKSYHARRCLLYYQYYFPDTLFFICPSDTGINRENWFQSSEGIDRVFGEFRRICSQFPDMLKRDLEP